MALFYEALRKGLSGTRALTLFDGNGIESRVVAEVPRFDPSRHVDPKDVKRVPRVVPMAACASWMKKSPPPMRIMNAPKRTKT